MAGKHPTDGVDPSRELPQSLALMPAGLEVVPTAAHEALTGQGEKEAIQPDIGSPGHYMPPDAPPSYAEQQGSTKRRICGLSTRLFWVILIASSLAIIGLAVGLGVGLSSRSSATATTTSNSSSTSIPTPGATPNPGDQYHVGGSLDPAYYSTRGAWNGSGIALSQHFLSNNSTDTSSQDLMVFFQHHSGDLRWMELASDGSWEGGSPSQIVAADARNSTPISAVAWVANQTTNWHVFCKLRLRTLPPIRCGLVGTDTYCRY